MAVTPGQQTGRLLLLQIGNGASPELFNNLCGVQTRSFNMSANDVDTTIPDCENPGDTPQKTGVPGIKNRTFTGSGKFVAGADQTAFMQHVIDATVFNAKVIVPGLGTFTGSWYVTDFTLNGEQEGTMGFDATFMAAGPLEFEAEV
ncbi:MULTISPECIES: phage tail tube protein [unclassified Mesorhizobium]|uniref:phage tail tube protein n=1 Tax=unclassified Mesorhizobium TaxID=325217 RepID=UPI001127F462|nr:MULTISPECIES: phage tail tube protein [unclassified Mesorhizobium]TPJ86958.1 phage tail protein [Mesorhizobium sp. B2-5-12]TPK19181.1 phage tail protein [Mesorhizobium sp. B2-5-6]